MEFDFAIYSQLCVERQHFNQNPTGKSEVFS